MLRQATTTLIKFNKILSLIRLHSNIHTRQEMSQITVDLSTVAFKHGIEHIHKNMD